MTIQIFNSSSNYSIYPVIEAGGPTGPLLPDEWMQGFFKTSKADLPTKTYRRLKSYRIFVNPTGNGIPPRKSVTVTLPLYTQIPADADVKPDQPDQYVNWWKGGRVYLYDSPFDTGTQQSQPPVELTKQITARPTQSILSIAATNAVLPTCMQAMSSVTCDTYQIYVDTGGGFKNNQPSQLGEYTLGAVDTTVTPYVFNDHNVDYDVSYVNNAYLPLAMGAYENKHVGYIGTIQPIDTFRTGLQKFLKAYPGWPQYTVDTTATPKPAVVPAKLVSPLELYTVGPSRTDMTAALKKNDPIVALTDNWNTCLKSAKLKALGKAPSKILKAKLADLPNGYCDAVKILRTLYTNNYNNYKTTYSQTAGKNAGCDQTKSPQKLTETLMIQHVYGWTPFNSNCTDAKYNLVADTPPDYNKNNYKKYQAVKSLFDTWQKASKGPTRGFFDPWVLLIHDSAYLNSPNAYSYSVDDALGNMQADARGVVFSIGGKDGLPNPTPSVPPIEVSFGGTSPVKKINFVKYGVCEDPPTSDVDPNYHTFIISPTEVDQCVMTLQDDQNMKDGKPLIYKVSLKLAPPKAGYPPVPPPKVPVPDANKAPVNCDDAISAATKFWCTSGAFVYSEFDPREQHLKHHLVLPPPLDSTSVKKLKR